MSEDEKRYTRRDVDKLVAAAAAASALSGDTAQPWPPTEELTPHDIERLVHWAQGEDAQGFAYGEYLGVRTRILDAWSKRESITPILHQLKEAQSEISPNVLCEHLLDVLVAYEHGTRLTQTDREIIRDIVAAWPERFETTWAANTRVALVDAIVGAAPVMRDLLLTNTVLTQEELTLLSRA